MSPAARSAAVATPGPSSGFPRALTIARAATLLAFLIALFFLRDLRDTALPASAVFNWGVVLLALLACIPTSALARAGGRDAGDARDARDPRDGRGERGLAVLAALPYAIYLIVLTIAWRLHADAPSTQEYVRQLALLATAAAVARIACSTGSGPWVATILVCLTLIIAQILGPSSMVDHFGRDQNYSAIEQWSGYPEIGLLASLGAGAAGALMLGGPGIALRIAGALLTSGFIAGLVFLYSRFSVLTAIAVVAWLALVCLTRWRRIVGLAIVVPFVLGGAWIAIGPGDTATHARDAISARLGSREMGIRAEGWRAARAMMAEAPWLGVGPGRYPYEYGHYSDKKDATHAYNIVLHTGAELGWLGLAAYLALWMRVMWISLAAAFARVRTLSGLAERAAALATHAMLVAFFVRSQSEHFLANLTTSFRLLLLVGVLWGLAEGVRARLQVAGRSEGHGQPPSV